MGWMGLASAERCDRRWGEDVLRRRCEGSEEAGGWGGSPPPPARWVSEPTELGGEIPESGDFL